MYKCAINYGGEVYGPLCACCNLFVWSYLSARYEDYTLQLSA
jgi:hypothetical protein